MICFLQSNLIKKLYISSASKYSKKLILKNEIEKQVLNYTKPAFESMHPI